MILRFDSVALVLASFTKHIHIQNFFFTQRAKQTSSTRYEELRSSITHHEASGRMRTHGFIWPYEPARAVAAVFVTIYAVFWSLPRRGPSLLRRRGFVGIFLCSLAWALLTHTRPAIILVLVLHLCRPPRKSRSARRPTTQRVSYADGPLVENTTPAAPSRGAVGISEPQARQTGPYQSPLQRIWMTLATSLWKSSSRPMSWTCATEHDVLAASSILVHFVDSTIYRFEPGSIVKISIDRHSFRGLSRNQRELLESGLRATICAINSHQLGITFQYVDNERGLVELKYGGDRGPHLWAMSETRSPEAEIHRPGLRRHVRPATRRGHHGHLVSRAGPPSRHAAP